VIGRVIGRLFGRRDILAVLDGIEAGVLPSRPLRSPSHCTEP